MGHVHDRISAPLPSLTDVRNCSTAGSGPPKAWSEHQRSRSGGVGAVDGEVCHAHVVSLTLTPRALYRFGGQLPYGNGKKVAIAVFARNDKADEARNAGAWRCVQATWSAYVSPPFTCRVPSVLAGATVVGAEDLVAAITAGNINFTKCIATPDMMPLVGRVARVSEGTTPVRF